MMAKVHNNEQDVQGIKLFGKTISVPEKQEKDDKSPAKKSKDDEDGNDQAIVKKPEKIISCPRCKSMETKFCYFNNYNVNQPRHFCKGCQRYWTAGGALRNVPIGAGRRKMKPPCLGGVVGFSEGCHLFDHVGSTVQQFDLHGMVEKWQINDTMVEGDLRHVFPVKRRRC